MITIAIQILLALIDAPRFAREVQSRDGRMACDLVHVSSPSEFTNSWSIDIPRCSRTAILIDGTANEMFVVGLHISYNPIGDGT